MYARLRVCVYAYVCVLMCVCHVGMCVCHVGVCVCVDGFIHTCVDSFIHLVCVYANERGFVVCV